jgi:hypothetical protein
LKTRVWRTALFGLGVAPTLDARAPVRMTRNAAAATERIIPVGLMVLYPPVAVVNTDDALWR